MQQDFKDFVAPLLVEIPEPEEDISLTALAVCGLLFAVFTIGAFQLARLAGFIPMGWLL